MSEELGEWERMSSDEKRGRIRDILHPVKGSDVRAAYVDTGTPKCPICQMPMNGSVECHLPSCTLRVLQEADVEAHAQAASVEMRNLALKQIERIVTINYQNRSQEYMDLYESIRALPVPTNAYDAALLQARLDELKNHGIEHCAGHSDAPGSCGTCIRIDDLERQLAALTQPAPERKEK